MELLNDPIKISPYIDSILIDLIREIKTANNDFIENSMILLYHFLNSASEFSVKRIVKFNIFGVIGKFLLGKNKEMRYLTASACAKIYKKRFFAQEEFLNHNGGFKLLQLLELSIGETGTVLANLLNNFIDLLQDEEEKPVEANIKRINDTMILETLNKIDCYKANEKVANRLKTLQVLLVNSPSIV